MPPWLIEGSRLDSSVVAEIVRHGDSALTSSNGERSAAITHGLVDVSSVLYQTLHYRQVTIKSCNEQRSRAIVDGLVLSAICCTKYCTTAKRPS